MVATSARVYINGRFLTQKITGVQRYAISMLQALDRLLSAPELHAAWQVTLVLPAEVEDLPPLRAVAAEVHSGVPGQLWEQVTLPLVARDGVLVNFCNRAPLLKSEQIVFVHDASVVSAPQGFSLLFQASYRAMYAALRGRTRGIVTVSEYSKQELLHRLGFDPGNLRVIYPGAEHILAVGADPRVEKFGLVAGKYALIVGSLQPNKNLAVVETAFHGQKPPFDIAIAGCRNQAVFRNARPNAPWMKELGYVSDAELRGLYENAGCFILPSLYEGFGLPAIEAMLLGCPVVASNAAALPEACGEAALYFDPRDPAALRRTVSAVMHSPLLRAQLAKRGRAQAARYTWDAAAQALLAAIADFAPPPAADLRQSLPPGGLTPDRPQATVC